MTREKNHVVKIIVLALKPYLDLYYRCVNFVLVLVIYHTYRAPIAGEFFLDLGIFASIRLAQHRKTENKLHGWSGDRSALQLLDSFRPCLHHSKIQ